MPWCVVAAGGAVATHQLCQLQPSAAAEPFLRPVCVPTRPACQPKTVVARNNAHRFQPLNIIQGTAARACALATLGAESQPIEVTNIKRSGGAVTCAEGEGGLQVGVTLYTANSDIHSQQ